MSIVKIGWSGGKDSTCAVDLHLEQGDTVKAVCYIPMFTDTIPLIQKEHYEFILRTADYFRSKGADVKIVTGITYYDFVHKRSTRGQYKGRAFGFPPFVRKWCNFKRDSKLAALAACVVGDYDYEGVGIAYDEVDRHTQLNERLRSILFERLYTEEMCAEYCRSRGLLSPQYNYSNRDGCVLCPHAKPHEREKWFNDYPEARDLVIELQEFVKRERPEQTPLRGYKWFIEV